MGLFPSNKDWLWNQRSSDNVSRVAEGGLGLRLGDFLRGVTQIEN